MFLLSLKPFLLQTCRWREFWSLVVAERVLLSFIHSATSRLQTQHLSAFVAISGEFNHVTMETALPSSSQYVSCPTREVKTLDLLDANVKDVYSSSPLPPLGRSDHNLVHLNPCYVPLVKSQPATTRTVRRWMEEAYEIMRGRRAHRVHHGLYFNICVDSTVPAETVHCYPNNKLWVTKDIK